MSKIGVDPRIYVLAEELERLTAEDLKMTLTPSAVSDLAEALQLAFEDWASAVEPKEEPQPSTPFPR